MFFMRLKYITTKYYYQYCIFYTASSYTICIGMLSSDESENCVMISAFFLEKNFLISPHYDLPTPNVAAQISKPALGQIY